MSQTPRWSQRRLFLPLAASHKFTLAVFRAVAQLWIVRRHSQYEVHLLVISFLLPVDYFDCERLHNISP
jgi:hypothetical protein